MTPTNLGRTRGPFHSSRHLRSPLTVFGLVAGLLALSAGSVAAAPPAINLSSSVVGANATISITVDRQYKAIASCVLISDTTTTDCGSQTSPTKLTTSYSVGLANQASGDHSVSVTVTLTDGGRADATATFTVLEIDGDGDGVPDAIDNCPTIANADQIDTYGSAKGDACEDSNGDGILDVNEADMCVSVNGVAILTQGTAFCLSDAGIGAANVAVANGSNANAAAQGGSGNRATAIGASAGAGAAFGDNNTATASGDNASAAALRGNNNTAAATGPNATAFAAFGDNNTATATGEFASATAANGDNNTAIATGDFVSAGASALAGCTYSAPPDGSCP